jgi:hypothetical protein
MPALETMVVDLPEMLRIGSWRLGFEEKNEMGYN